MVTGLFEEKVSRSYSIAGTGDAENEKMHPWPFTRPKAYAVTSIPVMLRTGTGKLGIRLLSALLIRLLRRRKPSLRLSICLADAAAMVAGRRAWPLAGLCPWSQQRGREDRHAWTLAHKGALRGFARHALSDHWLPSNPYFSWHGSCRSGAYRAWSGSNR